MYTLRVHDLNVCQCKKYNRIGSAGSSAILGILDATEEKESESILIIISNFSYTNVIYITSIGK